MRKLEFDKSTGSTDYLNRYWELGKKEDELFWKCVKREFLWWDKFIG